MIRHGRRRLAPLRLFASDYSTVGAGWGSFPANGKRACVQQQTVLAFTWCAVPQRHSYQGQVGVGTRSDWREKRDKNDHPFLPRRLVDGLRGNLSHFLDHEPVALLEVNPN